MQTKSYHGLNIYQESFKLFVEVFEFSLKLPKHEMYEQGSQLRRSADSVNSNIVEGYGRRSYKMDFVRFLTYSHASNLETINHLRKIAATHPTHRLKALSLIERYDKVGIGIYKFKCYVRDNWKT